MDKDTQCAAKMALCVCVRENATVQRLACSLQKKNRQIGRQMVNYDQLLFHVVSGIVYIVDSISVVMTVFIEEFMKLVRFRLVRMQFIFKPPSFYAKLSKKSIIKRVGVVGNNVFTPFMSIGSQET